jgi:hypothetical protein
MPIKSSMNSQWALVAKLKNKHDNNKIQRWENTSPRIMRRGLVRWLGDDEDV